MTRVRNSTAAAFALAVAALVAVSMTAWAGSAQATPVFTLRVEAPGATLDPGTEYAVPRSVLARRGRLSANNSGTCIAATGRHEVDGRTALGLVAAASLASGSLRPLYVAEDGFGRRVCRIDEGIEHDTPSFAGWLFRYNHVAPPMSAELVPLAKGSEVLWVFADFTSFANSGDELVLSAPVRATPGAVSVSVQAVTFDGNVGPAPDGTVVTGGSVVATTVGGVANVLVGAGEAQLRAVDPGAAPTQIPSESLSVCVSADLSRCPEERGRRIVGSNRGDRLKGGDGPDTIRTRGGNDSVKVKGGFADVVNCGRGKDVVTADAEDRLRKCERVRGPAGEKKK